MQSEILPDCVSTEDSTGTPRMREEQQSSSVPRLPPSPHPACLPHDSPTCPAQDPAAGLLCTMLPAQRTTSAPGILGWVWHRWAMATLRQVERSKKYCWSRSHGGSAVWGFYQQCPVLREPHYSQLSSTCPVTALVHFTGQKSHEQVSVPLYCLRAAQIYQARGRLDGATGSV